MYVARGSCAGLSSVYGNLLARSLADILRVIPHAKLYRVSFYQEEREEDNGRALFPAAGHVVDEGSIDIGAADADQIEEVLVVGNEVFGVHEFFVHDHGMAGVA